MEAFSWFPKRLQKWLQSNTRGKKQQQKQCGARKWPTEAPGLCWLVDKINLPTMQDPKEFNKNLLSQDTPTEKYFRKITWNTVLLSK